MDTSKIAIITTHPIQYNAPLFKKMSENPSLYVKVFYTWGQSSSSLFDPGFGVNRSWDISLLEGYEHTFLPNLAKNPGSHHFWGIRNPSIIHELDKFKPQSILVFGWNFYSHLLVLIKYRGKATLIFRGDSTLLKETNQSFLLNLARRTILKLVYFNVDFSTYVGTYNKEYYLRHGMKSSKLIFAPHAIDNSRFESESDVHMNDALLWKRRLNIPSENLVFLYVGKFEHIKNIKHLIQSFKKIENANINLILVGTGPLEGEFVNEAKEDNRILLLGFQNQQVMPKVYRLADILVLPSLSETWGLVVNEAFASGIPAIVSDQVGCSIDLVIPGKTGWIFSTRTEENLDHYLMIAIEVGKTGLVEMGKNAYRHIQTWNYDNIIQAILKITTK